MYGRERHVDVSFTAKISKILTAYIFKTKNLRSAFYLYVHKYMPQIRLVAILVNIRDFASRIHVIIFSVSASLFSILMVSK